MATKKLSACLIFYHIIVFLPVVLVQFRMPFPMGQQMPMAMNMPMQMPASMQQMQAPMQAQPHMQVQGSMQMPGSVISQPIYLAFRNQNKTINATPGASAFPQQTIAFEVNMPLPMSPVHSPIAMYCAKTPRPLDCPPCPPCKCAPYCTPPQFSNCSPCHMKCRCPTMQSPFFGGQQAMQQPMQQPMQQGMPMSFPNMGMQMPPVMVAPRMQPGNNHYPNNLSYDSESESQSDESDTDSDSSQEKDKSYRKKYSQKKKKKYRNRRSVPENFNSTQIEKNGNDLSNTLLNITSNVAVNKISIKYTNEIIKRADDFREIHWHDEMNLNDT